MNVPHTIGLCGGLVACRSTTQAGSFTMDTQYYDALGNYIEIPRLTAEGEGAQAVNQALTALKSQYQTVMDAPMNTVGGQQCLFYPAVTERYDNLIFYLDSASSGSDGGLYTLVYDRQEDRVVPLAEALELAGTTEDALCRGAEEYLNGELAGTEVALAAQDGAVTGFRIRDDGGVEFYLTCMTDDADPAVDAVDGWQHLLVYADGSWRRYNPLTEELLIPAEELAGFDPPLWYQWGPSGGVPEGGFLLQQIPEQVENQAQVFLEGEGYHAPPDSLLLRVCFDDLSGLELASEWQGYDAMECYRMTYSVPDTHRAVDLLFFRRGEDYTYVGELIGMDYQTVEPTRLASVGPYNYAVMYHLLEQGILTAFPEADAMLRDAPMPLAARNAAVAYFYSNRPADMSIFFADQAPLQPEGRTMRIDEASYLGLRQLYETYGVVYQLRCSGWEDGDWYAYPEPLWLVFQLGQGGDMTTVLGESVPRETVEQAALEQGYHLVDGTGKQWSRLRWSRDTIWWMGQWPCGGTDTPTRRGRGVRWAFSGRSLWSPFWRGPSPSTRRGTGGSKWSGRAFRPCATAMPTAATRLSAWRPYGLTFLPSGVSGWVPPGRRWRRPTGKSCPIPTTGACIPGRIVCGTARTRRAGGQPSSSSLMGTK